MAGLDCVLRDGSVFFRCLSCDYEQGIHQGRPFVPQLRQITEGHRCPVSIPRPRAPLTLVLSEQPVT
jgi:hypothetical protein